MSADYRTSSDYIKTEIRFIADTTGGWWDQHDLTMADRARALDVAMDALALAAVAESRRQK